MKMEFNPNYEISQSLLEKFIGQKVMEFLGELKFGEVQSQVNMEAVQVLSKIVEILDDDGTDDPECFRRIEEIIGALRDSGIATLRHDW